MKITSLIISILIQKLSFYQFNIAKQSKQSLELTKRKSYQIRKKEFLQSINQRIFLSSEFQTQITIFRDVETQFSGEKYLKPEQISTSNQLLRQIKSAQINFESKIIALFVYRLENLNELQQELIKTASYEPNRILSIGSFFILNKQQKLHLLKVIREKLSADVQVEFQLINDSNLGIELRDRGYKILSNLDYCITELEVLAEDQPAKEKRMIYK